jgi:hypothetical protein
MSCRLSPFTRRSYRSGNNSIIIARSSPSSNGRRRVPIGRAKVRHISIRRLIIVAMVIIAAVFTETTISTLFRSLTLETLISGSKIDSTTAIKRILVPFLFSFLL